MPNPSVKGLHNAAMKTTPQAAVKCPASYFPSIEKFYGQPVSHWLALLGKVGDKKHMALVAIIKSAHKMGHGHANALIAHHRSCGQ